MAIKAENKDRYPADWPAIRGAILGRAGNACEQCGVANRTRIARGQGADKDRFMTADGTVHDADTSAHLGRCRVSDFDTGRIVDVVLTIGHLDHTPEKCAPENLRAWCQRCHLRYDAAHHAETARKTRHSRRAVADLFEEGASHG